MRHIEAIAERLHRFFEERTRVRDLVLAQARQLTKHSALAITAIHQNDFSKAMEHLEQARTLVDSILESLHNHNEVYFEGYTQDALKEFAEANIFFSLVKSGHLPDPEELGLEYATYLKGLAESVGELRRHCLDLLRHERTAEAETILNYMDEIYAVLITMDYPDAVTGGLRRLTDMVRGVTERTRGDLTLTYRQEQLEESLRRLEDHL